MSVAFLIPYNPIFIKKQTNKQTLKDEVDVLRPAAQQLAGAEEALGKARARLQALQDVKEQLVAEQVIVGLIYVCVYVVRVWM